MALTVEVRRPRRWTEPFSRVPFQDAEIDEILGLPLFRDIDPAQFPPTAPLRDLIRYDTRLRTFRERDIVCRAGDYGTSTFLVIRGSVRVVLPARGDVTEDVLSEGVPRKKGLLGALRQLWSNSKLPEVRDYRGLELDAETGARDLGEGEIALFVQDLPRIIHSHTTAVMGAGEIFGELSALGRTPRTATTVVESESAELLEIRWQGLRDISRRAPELQNHLDQLYREHALEEQLRLTPLFDSLTPEQRAEVLPEVVFESFGDREWSQGFQRGSGPGGQEPIIAEEGHYLDGVLLIRSGFARVSQQFAAGRRTLRYLGKGQTFGFDEIVHNYRQPNEPIPFQLTLSAIGYVDVLRIPTRTMERLVLPATLARESEEAAPGGRTAEQQRARRLDQNSQAQTEALELLVENRFINGTATMVIDLDRCTRCDDCVRACAATHDNNPRFIRHGPRIGRFMIANACMHCVDPVCMIGCPTGAIHRQSFEGQVLIDDKICIGCATCANNCPYENIRMVETRDHTGALMLAEDTRMPVQKATKCDLCHEQRVSPACQQACPHSALRRVDMREPDILEMLGS